MKYTYDPIADAINITFKKGRVVETREVAPGIMIDFDGKGTPLYLEILDASKRFANKGTLGEVEFKPLRYSRRQVRELIAK